MANFIAIVDRNESRRQRFLHEVAPLIAPVEKLRVERADLDDFGAVWAIREGVPVSSTISADATAIVWGDAIPGPGPERLSAAGLLMKWAETNPRPFACFDGFYAALRYDAKCGIVAGVDLLGLFPLYYASTADALVIASSPELFQRHPLFPATMDAAGLVGLLMTNGILGGRSLLKGVRRLQPGHVLEWRPDGHALETRQYSIPVPETDTAASFADDVEQLDSVFSAAMYRHMPADEPAAMLLSGGRDSRQIAGYLREQGSSILALTLGNRSDYEMVCAVSVGRALGSDHHVVPLDDSRFPAAAELQAKWEHLCSGFSNVHMWEAIQPLSGFPPHFVSGYMLDMRDLEPMPDRFEETMRTDKHRGMPASTLQRLLRREVFDGLPVQIEREMKSVYEAGCSLESQRATRFFLAHDWRGHAGAVPWKLTFGSWPVLPVLDRALLETLFVLPQASIANRRAQDEILRRRFPDLARLPLDRNTYDTTPLLPSAADRLRQRLNNVLDHARYRMPPRLERRYYHRIYDINGPGWRAVRRRAEPFRELLADIVDMKVMRELLPAPEETVVVTNKIRESFGTKQLIGLMLWSGRNIA
ncbi:MAG TPA: asparagine synthase-related protein [Gemmatimonadaceae bacterium]|nr:asparagine synthase-related protein [Gemmatimonadaceae bacterium]